MAAGLLSLILALSACEASKPFVAPAPKAFDGRYVGTRKTVYPKCSADLQDFTLVVRDNAVPIKVVVSELRMPIEADGTFSGGVSTMRASGKIVDRHMSFELVGTECFYRFELDKK